MDLATRLALKCVSAEKQAASPQDIRQDFEGSASRERSLREYAQKLKELGDQRAQREDTSLGGYAETAATRLAPLPQTLGEAAWRLPAIGASGVGGYMAGARLEETDPLGLSKRVSTLYPNALKKVLTEAATDPEHQLNKVFRAKAMAIDPLLSGAESALEKLKEFETAGKEYEKVLPLHGEYLKQHKADSAKKMFEHGENLAKYRHEVAKGDHAYSESLGKNDFERDTIDFKNTHKQQKPPYPPVPARPPVPHDPWAPPLAPEPSAPPAPKIDPKVQATGMAARAKFDKITAALRRAGTSEPTDVAGALRPSPLGANAAQKQIRKVLADALGGDDHIPFARSQFENAINAGKGKPGPLAELMPEFKPYRVGGALAGLGLGSIATGAPLAARALYLKRHGGEAAARARAKMQAAIEQAEAEAGQREGLLSQLPKGAK